MKRLYEVLDRRSIEKLIAEFGGKRIWIPKGGNRGYRNPDYIEQRNKDIQLLFKSGKSVKELAKIYRLSRKTIYGIVNARGVSAKPGPTRETQKTILAGAVTVK